MSSPTARAVLYAEDDPDDRLLAEMAHRDSGAVNRLVLIVKPSPFASLVHVFKRLCGYWFEISALSREVTP